MLIRHGEQIDKRADTDLTHLGIQQAKGTGDHLKDELGKLSPDGVKGVYSSESIRTRRTAEIATSFLGTPRIVTDVRLSEYMRGLPFEELTDDQRRELLIQSGQDKGWKPEYVNPDTVESVAESVKRFTAFLQELPDAPVGETPYTYLAFTHGGVKKEYLNSLPAEVTYGKWSGGRIEHCAMTTVVMDGENVTALEGVNDVTHLEVRGIEGGKPSAWRK